MSAYRTGFLQPDDPAPILVRRKRLPDGTYAGPEVAVMIVDQSDYDRVMAAGPYLELVDGQLMPVVPDPAANY